MTNVVVEWLTVYTIIRLFHWEQSDLGICCFIWPCVCLFSVYICLHVRGFENNIGADQPAHLRSLISALVIRSLESIISKLATNKYLFLKLVSAAEKTALSLISSETPKTGYLTTGPKWYAKSVWTNTQHFVPYHTGERIGSDGQAYMCSLT